LRVACCELLDPVGVVERDVPDVDLALLEGNVFGVGLAEVPQKILSSLGLPPK